MYFVYQIAYPNRDLNKIKKPTMHSTICSDDIDCNKDLKLKRHK